MSSPRTRTVGPLDLSGAAPLPMQPGDVVAGRYEVLRFLGSGGSAFVYAVRDRTIGDEIALKLLRDERRSAVDVARSRREAEFARGSASPRLVRTFDLVESGGSVFLTMELVSGGSLRDLLGDGPLPVDDAVRLAGEILEALVELHRLDIVHRDLKPGNLLLTPDGHVKLSDFGIARRWTDEDARLTRTGLVVGTYDYLSPEQADEKDVDPRSDLYSFGVVLFEMLTGRVPFEATSAAASLAMRLHRRAEDVRKLRPETPRWLAAVVARLLATKREERYASAAEALEDLQRKRARWTWRPLRWTVVAVLLVIAGVAGVMVWQGRRVESLNLVQNGDDGMRAIDAKGETVWARRDLRASHAAFVRRGDTREIAAILALPKARPSDPIVSRTLSFLDPGTGRVLRSRALPYPSTSFTGFSDHFGVAQVLATDLNHDGFDEVVVTYTHDYWPCFLVLHDLRRDEGRLVLVAAGHHRVVAVEDVDGDGNSELIVEGIANRQGWYRGLGAVRVPLDQAPEGPFPSTPERVELLRSRLVLWYALRPLGMVRNVTADRRRRVIRSEYGESLAVEVSFDGFDTSASSSLPPAERQAAREQAYKRLRDARRMAESGLGADAVHEADAALALATRVGDPVLTEWSERVRGIALIRARRFEEAEAFFTRIARSGNASEIAWDAAHEFHLEGELPRALAWYRRNLGREGQPGVGRLKYESIEGAVLALGEMGRWQEALAEVDRFPNAFPNEAGAWDWYRRYVSWRVDGPTAAAAPGMWEDPIDLYRYWALEISLARGEDPDKLLRAIDADRKRASETRSLLLVARAEALRRLGRTDEALEVAREAKLALRGERRHSVLARAHFDLAAERLAALADANGLTAEARQVRAEAAALRWHP